MHRTLIMLSLCAALTTWGGQLARKPVGLTSLELQDGTVVSGDLEQQELGFFLHLPSGGRLLRWSQINPASLPEVTRETVRDLAFKRLEVAHRLYEGGNPLAAKPYYEEAYALHAYFHVADREHPLLADFGYKLRGWIEVDGEWVAFEAYQRSLGNVFYAGRWMARAEAVELKTFREAATKAQAAKTVAAVDWAINQALAEYPDSIYEQAARKLRDQLVGKIRVREEREARLADAREAEERGWNHRDNYPKGYWEHGHGYIDPRYYSPGSIVVTDGTTNGQGNSASVGVGTSIVVITK